MDIKELMQKTKQFNILYVEDDETVREQMSMILKMLFNVVDIAKNGVEALEKYKNNKYDLIITDVTMPNMNGIELLKEIKKIDSTQKIIILSAHREDEFIKEAKDLGVNGIIFKPIELDEMSLVFKEVMGI